MLLGKLDGHMRKNEIGPLSYSIPKILDQNGLNTYILEESIRKKPFDLGACNCLFFSLFLLGMTAEAQVTKAKQKCRQTKQVRLHHTKGFCAANEKAT